MNNDIITIAEEPSTVVTVPVNAVQVDLVTDAGVTVYVPLATRTSPGIVKIGDGLLIDPTTGLLSLDTDEITLLGVKVNGTALIPDEDKYVDVIVPTKTSDLTNDGDGESPYATQEYVWNYGGAVNGLILNNVTQEINSDKMIVVNINKSTVGLNNVDNTSDLDKPISTAVNTALTTLQGNIDAKLDQSKADTNVMNNLTSSVSNDNVTLTRSFINLKTQTASTSSFSLPLATDETGGLMSSADYVQIRNNTSRIEQLEGQTKRLLYTDKTNPTAQEINAFVVDLGYTSPFSGIAVVVDQTFHIWHYYTNTSSWEDDGPDTVSQFTNSSPGVILGSATAGKVYAENDGTGSVYGWDSLTNRVSDLETNMPTHTSDLTNDGDGLSYNTVNGYDSFDDTDDYVGYYVLISDTYTEVTEDNKDSLSITPGTTVAYEYSPFATEAYVALNGGKIDSISVNHVAQIIDANKNVNLTVPTVASLYDATSTYAVGAIVQYDNVLYRCTTAITTAEAFDSTHWTAITLSDFVNTFSEQNVSGIKTFLSQLRVKRPADGGGYFYVSPDGNGYNVKMGFSSGGQMMIHNGGFQIDRNLYPMTANTNIDLGTSSVLWNNLYLKGNLSDGTNSITVANIANKNDILLKPLTLTTTTMTDEQIAQLRAYNCVLTNDLVLGTTSLKAGTILTVPFEYSNSLRGMAIYNNKIMTYYISLTSKQIGDGAQDIVISNVANIKAGTVTIDNYNINKDSFGQLQIGNNNAISMQFDGGTVRAQNLVPIGNNSKDLGSSGQKWRDLYLAGNLTDGTNSISIANIANVNNIPTDYVSYNSQTLTDAQKAQARQNIGAGSANATTVLVNGVDQASVSFGSDPQTQITNNANAIADKQNTIDSSHKLSADLVDDSISTNKFVTSVEKEKLANINKVQNKRNVFSKATMPMWVAKKWNGMVAFGGTSVWHHKGCGDTTYTYYSDDILYAYDASGNLYIFDENLNAWKATGVNNRPSSYFSNESIWSDGRCTFYSYQGYSLVQKVWNPSDLTWTDVTWTGLTAFDGSDIWSDGTNIYCSPDGTTYKLQVAGGNAYSTTWEPVTFTVNGSSGIIYGKYVWADNENIYYSNGSIQLVLDKANNNWVTKVWNGRTNFSATRLWTDDKNIYYSENTSHYVLNRATDTWEVATWTGLTSFSSYNIWKYHGKVYYGATYELRYILSNDEETSHHVPTYNITYSKNYIKFIDCGVATSSSGPYQARLIYRGCLRTSSSPSRNGYMYIDWGDGSVERKAFNQTSMPNGSIDNGNSISSSVSHKYSRLTGTRTIAVYVDPEVLIEIKLDSLSGFSNRCNRVEINGNNIHYSCAEQAKPYDLDVINCYNINVSGNTGLKHIKINNIQQTFGDNNTYAIDNCANLESIEFADGCYVPFSESNFYELPKVKTIDMSNCYRCEFPTYRLDNILDMEHGVYYTTLETLILPEAANNDIEVINFSDATALKNLTLLFDSVPELDDSETNAVPTNCYIYVKPEMVSAFKTEPTWISTGLADKIRPIIQNTAENIFPINSIYLSTSSTNPSVYFGGTWTQIGQGRVLIGAGTGTDSNNTSQTFTAGNTGGEYSHTLTTTEMPSHSHTVTDNGHSHGITDPGHKHGLSSATNNSGWSGVDYSTKASSWATRETWNATTGISVNSATTGISIANNGSDGAHNNIQPYLVCYMWQRTA